MVEQNCVDSNSDLIFADLKAEDDFMLALIDTIPPKAYFNQEVQEYLEEKKCNSTDNALKALKTEKTIAARGKQKRARLDPSQNQTVSQVISELYKGKSKSKKNKNSNHNHVKETATNIDDLQDRLRIKIQQLQSARKSGLDNGDKQSKRLQRKLAKMKKKSKGNVKKAGLTNGVSVPEEAKPKPPSPEPSKPVYNKEGKIVYSKFDLCENGTTKTHKKDGSNRNLKKTLWKVKNEEKRLAELTEEDPEKAAQTVNKQQWKKALGKIEGVKAKDDPELLKKTIKKQDQLRKHSQKKWKERTENVENLQKQRQDKRKANIQERRRGKIEKKINRAKKKGRILPGF